MQPENIPGFENMLNKHLEERKEWFESLQQVDPTISQEDIYIYQLFNTLAYYGYTATNENKKYNESFLKIIKARKTLMENKQQAGEEGK